MATSITTLNTTDGGATSRTVINANFSSLDTNKMETVLTDTTTGDVSTSAHGLVPKAPNDTTKYLRGDATWATINTYPNSFDTYAVGHTAVLKNWCTDSLGDICAGSNNDFRFQTTGIAVQRRLLDSDWVAVDSAYSAVVIGSYLYILMIDNGTTSMRVYRYLKSNLAAGGTLMTTSGQSFGSTSYSGSKMISDTSGNLYFTGQAGNSASYNVISKYSISGTTLTFVSNTTCGATSLNFSTFVNVDSSGNFYGLYDSGDQLIRKYNSSGTLLTTYSNIYVADGAACINGNIYLSHSSHVPFYNAITL